MFNSFNTLSHRLTFGYTGAFTVFLLCAFIAAFFSLSSLLNARLAEDLQEDLLELQLTYSEGGLEKTLASISTELDSGDPSEIFFRVVTDNEELLFQSNADKWEKLESALRVDGVDGYPFLHRIHLPSQDYDTQVIQGLLSPQGPLIQIGESTEENAEIMRFLLWLFIAMSILVLPLAYAVGWLVSQQAVKGIAAVSEAALDIENGNLDRQVQIAGTGSEIQQLGQRFNAMAQRIRQLVSEMREMTDNIAHDLRSPITRIRATAEVMGHNSVCSASSALVIQECDSLIQLINTTLDVSEAEAGVIQGREELVDMGQLTHDVCELFEPAMEEHGLVLRCEINSVLVRGFRSYLQRLLANLLDNALKYTPQGGTITVKCHNGTGCASLVVTDTGIGIADTDLNRVFDRFFRGDQTRQESGSGLGLSFCRAVVRAHKGSIRVASKLGNGTQFTLSLPIAN